jgi:hypothetical protein
MKTTEGSNGKSRAETQDSFSVVPQIVVAVSSCSLL